MKIEHLKPRWTNRNWDADTWPSPSLTSVWSRHRNSGQPQITSHGEASLLTSHNLFRRGLTTFWFVQVIIFLLGWSQVQWILLKTLCTVEYMYCCWLGGYCKLSEEHYISLRFDLKVWEQIVQYIIQILNPLKPWNAKFAVYDIRL